MIVLDLDIHLNLEPISARVRLSVQNSLDCRCSYRYLSYLKKAIYSYPNIKKNVQWKRLDKNAFSPLLTLNRLD